MTPARRGSHRSSLRKGVIAGEGAESPGGQLGDRESDHDAERAPCESHRRTTLPGRRRPTTRSYDGSQGAAVRLTEPPSAPRIDLSPNPHEEDGMSWSIEGTYFETCSCELMC